MRIGILEDNPAICEWLQDVLERAGHSVSIYSHPTAFLATTLPTEPPSAPTRFDLLIVDLLLPDPISGREVMHSVKRTCADLPVLMISAGSAAQIEAALEALPGVKALRKPFKIAALLAAIEELTPAS